MDAEIVKRVPAALPAGPIVANAAPRETAAVSTSGDLVLAPDAVLTVSVAAGGTLRIGRGVQLDASGAGVTIEVGEGARIGGHLECQAQLIWSAGAAAGSVRCAGPLVLRGERIAASVVASCGIASRGGSGVPS